ERSREVRGTVISALIYPAILATVAVLSIAVMLGFVVPQFEALFADMGDALPALTRAVIALGDGIKAYGWLMLIALVLGGYGIRRWLRQPAGQSWKDRTLLSLPLFGAVLFKYEVARFSRTMGTLLGNGVSMLQAINIALSTVENGIVRQSFQILPPAVKAGRRMSEALAESGDFTPMVIQMVRVGEESGRLDEMLLELARVYEHDVQAGIKRGLTLLEPLLILGMGGMIALIIISILMGILSVNDMAM
ncbi:MAG: type II secretion system F family protein, partial [Porticoccaceae bacterium]